MANLLITETFCGDNNQILWDFVTHRIQDSAREFLVEQFQEVYSYESDHFDQDHLEALLRMIDSNRDQVVSYSQSPTQICVKLRTLTYEFNWMLRSYRLWLDDETANLFQLSPDVHLSNSKLNSFIEPRFLFSMDEYLYQYLVEHFIQYHTDDPDSTFNRYLHCFTQIFQRLHQIPPLPIDLSNTILVSIEPNADISLASKIPPFNIFDSSWPPGVQQCIKIKYQFEPTDYEGSYICELDDWEQTLEMVLTTISQILIYEQEKIINHYHAFCDVIKEYATGSISAAHDQDPSDAFSAQSDEHLVVMAHYLYRGKSLQDFKLGLKGFFALTINPYEESKPASASTMYQDYLKGVQAWQNDMPDYYTEESSTADAPEEEDTTDIFDEGADSMGATLYPSPNGSGLTLAIDKDFYHITFDDCTRVLRVIPKGPVYDACDADSKIMEFKIDEEHTFSLFAENNNWEEEFNQIIYDHLRTIDKFHDNLSVNRSRCIAHLADRIFPLAWALNNHDEGQNEGKGLGDDKLTFTISENGETSPTLTFTIEQSYNVFRQDDLYLTQDFDMDDTFAQAFDLWWNIALMQILKGYKAKSMEPNYYAEHPLTQGFN